MLGPNRYGKSGVRVFKLHRGRDRHEITDLTVRVLLSGDYREAHVAGDNQEVLPTDTMKNTLYGLAQDHLGPEIERFGLHVARHLLDASDAEEVSVTLSEQRWDHIPGAGHAFSASGAERKLARVVVNGHRERVIAGLSGLLLLKSAGSRFSGFPWDRFTTLEETQDRILATRLTAWWTYSDPLDDYVVIWDEVRSTLLESFATFDSASAQNQGYEMGRAALASHPEVGEIRLRLPNVHHLEVDLTPFAIDDRGVVFQPVDKPYGDIALTVQRDGRPKTQDGS
ncbi:MAG TPA: urate oxidase [Acidimicrobiia bacterium]|nr:urate oxidase [Acidimicrobiia bacterium]